MSKDIQSKDRGLLYYRPELVYSEPDQLEGVITPVEEPVQIEDVDLVQQKVKLTANAVSQLSTAVQAVIDLKSAEVHIALDPVVDAATISSLKRMFGKDIDATKITYQQYRECYERLKKRGLNSSTKVLVTPEQVAAIRNKMQSPLESVASSTLGTTALGGFNLPISGNGGLRPELQSQAKIIEPLDIDKFQADSISGFVNMIWKDFLKPVIPGGDGLPDTIAPEGEV